VAHASALARMRAPPGRNSRLVIPRGIAKVIGISGVLRDRSFATSSNPLNECGNASGWGATMTKAAAPMDRNDCHESYSLGRGHMVWAGHCRRLRGRRRVPSSVAESVEDSDADP